MREAIRELIRGHQRPSEAIREARIEWRRTCRMMREAIKGAQGRSHLQDDEGGNQRQSREIAPAG
jgi:hypothetical protein